MKQVICKWSFLIFILTNVVVNAQPPFDFTLGYVPHFRNIRDVEIHNNALFAVGGWESNDSIASIFSSTDNGLNWNFVTDNINAIIQDVDFVGNNGYAVGWKGNFWKSTNDGASWVSFPMSGVLHNRDFNDCHWFNQSTAIAVGGKIINNDTLTTIVKSQDGGISWDVVMDSPGPRLNSITFLNDLDGYAVGDNSLAFRTLDGGITWNPINLPLVNRNLNEISFSYGTNIGIIVGGWPMNDSIGSILRTLDQGLTWEVVEDNIGGQWQGMCWIDDHQCCIVGDDGRIHWTIDGGVNWNDVNVNVDNGLDWHDVHFITPGKALFGGASGKYMLAVDPVNGVFNTILESQFYFNSKSDLLHFKNLESCSAEQILVQVYDLQGSLVFENNYAQDQFPVPLSTLSSGGYVVSATGNFGTSSLKIIME